MAVRIDAEAVRNAVPAPVLQAAQELLANRAVDGITNVGGGAAGCVMVGPGVWYDTWVGIVEGAFVCECDCLGEEPDEAETVADPRAVAAVEADVDDLCCHAIAVTLGALERGLTWSAAATPPSLVDLDPRIVEFEAMAAGVGHRRLAGILGEFAALDRRVETALLTAAGKLAPPTQRELDDLRQQIDTTADDALEGEWDLYDVIKAAEGIILELQVLAQRTATPAAVQLVEHAAMVFDDLIAPLFDAWERFEGLPEQLGAQLRAVHVGMCWQVRPDPDRLAERVREVIEAAECTSCLDMVEDYLPLVGQVGLAPV